SPGYIPESDPEEDPEEDDEEDPEEDPADYPADRGDDDDDDTEEEEHLAPADPAAVAYSADQDPYIAYRITARMSIRTQTPAPFLSEEVAERVLALPTSPPSPLSPYSSPLPQIPSPLLPIPPPSPLSPTYVEGSLGSRAARIRRRDALPVHETKIPEMWLPLRKRLCRTTPGPGYEVGESSAAGTARQFGPTTAKADLYGFTDMLESTPGRQMSRELGYGIRDTWDDLRMRSYILSWMMHGMTELYLEPESTGWTVHSEGISLRTTVMVQQSELTELQAADRRRQAVITDLLKADYQMTELQRQQGPAKDPAEPELPEEASSSS
ncbi:hypothetical protein Tco_1436100, partial [Tanacetum coccineum]